MSWWHLTPDELLSGETVVREKAAGAFIKLKDFNLRSLGSWNWAGTEKLGGRLHLTNYRLIFAANKANRVVGKFSIILPTIKEIENTSFLIDRRIRISTQTQAFEFQVWGIQELTRSIISARDSIDAEGKRSLASKLTKEFPRLQENLNVSKTLNKIVERMALLEHVVEDLTGGENPLREMLYKEDPPTASTVLSIVEFLGENLKKDG